MSITERLNNGADYGADCYIVTGSIGPQFEPVLFKKLSNARKYARKIIEHGKREKIAPQFNVVIEWRTGYENMRNIKKEA